MKRWKIDYSVRNNITGDVEELGMIVEAYNIVEAVETVARKYAEQPPTCENSDMVFWNVGIIEDDVF